MHMLLALLLLNVALIAPAIYLIVHSIRRLHRYDHLTQDLKRKHSTLADLID